MNHLARLENMVKGLKILTHDNTALYNSTLLAGVDNNDSENSSDQESIQDNQDCDQTNEDEESEHNQDKLDPNIIAEAKVIYEHNILLGEENNNQ